MTKKNEMPETSEEVAQSMALVSNYYLLENTAKELKKRGFRVVIAKDREAVKNLIDGEIQSGMTIGVGDSVTVRQVGVLEVLEQKGVNIINPFRADVLATKEVKKKDFEQMIRSSIGNDVYICSVNAVTKDGELMSIDRVGNRVVGTIFGGKKVILVVGRNKVVANIERAYDRLKNIVVPLHSAKKKRHTPCSTLGKCIEYDNKRLVDHSSDRMCNITMLIEGKPLFTDIYIILINEDLGLGWEMSWPDERINAIKSAYMES